MIYIVFPVYNRIENTKRFLKSLKKQSYQFYKIIICDDGSEDGTSDYIKQNYPGIILVQGNGNLWWTGGINKCVAEALRNCDDGDYILTINNDVEIPESYLENMAMRAKEYPCTIIGSICLFLSNPKLIETTGFVADFEKGNTRSLTKVGERKCEKHSGVKNVTHLPGKGVLIPAIVFKDIGLYDERNFPHYHADTDFTLRAFKAGYKVLVDFDSVVYSDVNLNNMVVADRTKITLRGFIKTFIGRYSMNNFSIRYNFARKHFSNNRLKYFVKYYFRVIGGFCIRYFKVKILRKAIHGFGPE